MISITSRGAVEQETSLASSRSSLMRVNHHAFRRAVDRHDVLWHDRKQPLGFHSVTNNHDVVASVPEHAAHNAESASAPVYDQAADQIFHIEFARTERR